MEKSNPLLDPIRAKLGLCLENEMHEYRIVKGSGRKTGTPLWICSKCKSKKRSS